MATVITVAMFFSCKNNFNEVQKIGVSANAPLGIAENINLKYTDSGRVVANLLSAKMTDYTNRDFGFTEFTNGVTLNLFDENRDKSIVVADYAIVYDETGLIDMQGNVKLTTHDGKILETQQMYYDQNREWLFTNHQFTFETETDYIKGNSFNSDINFDNYEINEFGGSLTIDE